MKIRAVGAGLLLVAAGATPAVADEARPLCHLNDDGTWTYSADHYDDAREGGHVMDRMVNSDGTCTWPVVNPHASATIYVRVPVPVVRTVVRTKVVTKRVVIRKGVRTVTRKVEWR